MNNHTPSTKKEKFNIIVDDGTGHLFRWPARTKELEKVIDYKKMLSDVEYNKDMWQKWNNGELNNRDDANHYNYTINNIGLFCSGIVFVFALCRIGRRWYR